MTLARRSWVPDTSETRVQTIATAMDHLSDDQIFAR